MHHRILLLFTLIAIALHQSANATTLQITAGIESSQYLDAVNLTDDSPSVSLSADWSFDSGSFTGLECYASAVDMDDGLDSGCSLYAGYFTEISDQSAVSAQITRHNYSTGFNGEWSFTDLTASWHLNKKTRFSSTYSRNWLNRPFDTLSIKADTTVVLSDRFNLDLSGSVIAIESGTAVNTLTFAKAALSFTQSRWTTEVGIIYTDSDQIELLPFDVDDAEISLTFSYRLY